MEKELDELLCSKYPKIFRDRHAPMTETCMCWGFECGDGWFNILDQLCGNIQHHIDFTNKADKIYGESVYKGTNRITIIQVVASQVKEKFGTLRFYYNGGDNIIDGMVRMAESMSGVTCEECAAPAETTVLGWVRTICKPCETARNENRAKEMKK